MKPLNHREPAVHCFDLPFVQHLMVGWCRVQIYAPGVLGEFAPLTVVLSDVPGYQGPSLTNNIELIAEVVCDHYLEPLRLGGQAVRWLQYRTSATSSGEEWHEVQFRARRERFGEPEWRPAQPVRFGWDAVLGGTCWAREAVLLDGRQVAPDELQFAPEDCHASLTGACSLEAGLPDVGRGRAAYHYCRNLALLAEVWRLILEYTTGVRPADLDARALRLDGGLRDYVGDHWPARFGPPPEDRGLLPFAVEQALACYGPRQDEPISLQHGLAPRLRNGAHRVCVARRLGVPVCAERSAPRPRACAPQPAEA